jgi:acetyl esterase/lipase
MQKPDHANQRALPETLPLYPADQAPTDLEEATVFHPAPGQGNGAGIILFPGGGYGMLSMEKEGYRPANWLADLGFVAMVAPYRVAPNRFPAPLLDARRAIALMRAQSGAWGIAPDKLGVMGYSAGGHLAAMCANLFQEKPAEEPAEVADADLRPDFCVLCYPVIDMLAGIAHQGSVQNLLGPEAPEDERRRFSMHLRVTGQTPPTFLWHTSQDEPVPPQNSMGYYDALHRHGVPAELHIYRKGPHGMDMGESAGNLRPWVGDLQQWLQSLLADPEIFA